MKSGRVFFKVSLVGCFFGIGPFIVAFPSNYNGVKTKQTNKRLGLKMRTNVVMKTLERS